MRIIFMGSGAFAQPTLRWLAQSDHEIASVISQPSRGRGRGRRIAPTPVAEMATELRLPVLEVEDVNEAAMVSQVRKLDARLGVVIAFGQKLGPELLGAMPSGCINLHASLLPKYRGAAPINWAIVRGEERTGCTVFRIVSRMDAGPILTSRWTAIKPDETAGELHDRLAAVGVDAMQAALALFADGHEPPGEPQNDAEATVARKLQKSDGWMRFDQPTDAILRHACGMSPWPGATAVYEAQDGRWEPVAVMRVRRTELPEEPKQPPGTIDSRRYVAALDGYLEILEIKPSSGRLMTWPEYCNGRHVAAGDRLSTPTNRTTLKPGESE